MDAPVAAIFKLVVQKTKTHIRGQVLHKNTHKGSGLAYATFAVF